MTRRWRRPTRARRSSARCAAREIRCAPARARTTCARCAACNFWRWARRRCRWPPRPRAVNQLLLRGGASIVEINVVRKHFSAFEGGRLALAAAPAPVVTLLLSDVVGGPLDAVGSGPTLPDPSSWADAARILQLYELYN